MTELERCVRRTRAYGVCGCKRCRGFKPLRHMYLMIAASTWREQVFYCSMTLIFLVHLYAWMLVIAAYIE